MKSIFIYLLASASIALAQTKTVGPQGQGIGTGDRSAFLDALGGTTAGKSLFQMANPSAITFPRINADNTVSALNESDFKTALKLGNAANSDTVDRLPWTRKSIVNAANLGQSTSVRVLVAGDSIGVDGWPKQAFQIFGPVTTAFRLTSTSPTRAGSSFFDTSQFSYWPSGNITRIQTSGTAIYPTDASGYSAGSYRIFYVTEPGAGTFNIERRSTNYLGAWLNDWVTLASGVSADAALGAGVQSFTVTGSKNQIRITGVSGTVRFIGLAVIETANSVLEICAAEGGTTPSQQATTDQTILNSVLGNLAPTLCFWRGYESQEDLTNHLPTFISKLRTAVPNLDLVFTGLHPMPAISDAENKARNKIVADYAYSLGANYIDGFSPFVDTATMSALGYLADTIHLSNQGNVEMQYVQTQALPLLESALKYPSSKYRLPSGISGTSNPNFTVHVDGTVAAKLGFSSSFGASPGFYLPSNISEWRAGSVFCQFNSIDSRLCFNGNGLWAGNFGSIPYSGVARGVAGSIEGMALTTSSVGVVAAGIAGQTANIFEVRTGATLSNKGTLVSGAAANGRLFSSLGVYADDAAADADAALPSGGFYRTTAGGRAVYQKP